MGQYFRGAVLKKNHKLAKEPVLFALSPYKFGTGAKLMEHSYIGNTYVNAYMQEISDEDGYFFEYPFVWVGDYADGINSKEYYFHAREIEDESYIKYGKTFKAYDFKHYKYLINFSKKEYVVIPKMKPQVWQVHPLPLLTAYGNGRGNGDYLVKNEYVGRWAFDRIGSTNDESIITRFNLKEIHPDFKVDF